MAVPPGPLGKPFATTRSSSPRGARRWWGVGLALFFLLPAGCREDNSEQLKAYQEALAAIDREKATLHNVRAEQQRVYGEYQLHDLEGRIWSGDFSLSGVFGLPWSDDDYTSTPPLSVYLHDKLPLGWVGQLDRILVRKPEVLPWYNRTEGGLHRRKTHDRFDRALTTLRDRVLLQEDRVRKSNEYAKLIEPDTAKQ